MLSIAGPSIDFVILHWYPGGADAAEALAKPAQVVDIAEMTRAQITRLRRAGLRPDRHRADRDSTPASASTPSRARCSPPTRYPRCGRPGVFTVDWWNVRNGIGTVSTVAGQTDYGDFGLLSSGSCTTDGTVCEPPLNTPFAPYHALALLDRFADPGDQLLRVTTDDPLVRGHAVRRPNGELAVLLLNEDPDHARTVALDYAGYTPSPNAPKVSTYLNGATGIVESRTGTAASQTLPAYSLTVFTLKPKLLPHAAAGRRHARR